jgi:predicted small secreted protein
MNLQGKTMSKLKRILICISAVLTFSLFLAGCNTVRGAGEDIQEAGEAVENAAD